MCSLNRHTARKHGAFLLWFVWVALWLPASAAAWGRRAHEMVNAAAIRDLPAPLRAYFQVYAFEIVDRASEPDELARGNRAEERHHFTDADAYDSFPFRQLRQQFVVERLGPTRTEMRNGDSIWQIERFTVRLENDFRRGWRASTVNDAIFAAHYAADLTQPLHTTANFDGQRTGQRGIHQAFESGVVNLCADGWTVNPKPAAEIFNLRARIFSELLTSYQASGAVFAADREVRKRVRPGDPQYLPALARLLGPLARSRLDDAACFVASLWYTAWKRAGSPDLRAFASAASSGLSVTPRQIGYEHLLSSGDLPVAPKPVVAAGRLPFS